MTRMACSSRAELTWRLGTTAVLLAFALDPLGTIPNTVVLAVVLAAALQVLHSRSPEHAVNSALLVISFLIVLVAALEILNPNVPSLTIGLLGFRKSATFVLGVIIGLGWRGSRMRGLRLTWYCMFVVAVASIVIHQAFPSIEDSITRGAGEYVATIGGAQRMQGILAGPFHVAMLGAFLFVSALAPGRVIRSPWLRLMGGGVGLASIYLAQVRTGIVAIAVGAIVMTFAGGSIRRWVNRSLILVSFGTLAVFFIGPITDYARNFPALRLLLERGLEENRFARRYTTWSHGLQMIEHSPFIGYGSGSAGDTLGGYFTGADHITVHNTFLKYAIEGGLIQGLLFASLCVALIVAVRPAKDPTGFGAAAAVTFFVFAFVIAAPESMPVSFGLAVIMGLCANQSSANNDIGEAPCASEFDALESRHPVGRSGGRKFSSRR